MRTLVLLVACFAYACHGRRVQAMPQHSQGKSSHYVQDSKEFVNLLFSLKPEAAFNFAAPGSRFRGGAPLAPDGPGTPGNSYGSGWDSMASPWNDYYARDGITNDYYGLDGFTPWNSYGSSPRDYNSWDGIIQGGEMARQQARRGMWQGGYGEMGRYGSSPNYAWGDDARRRMWQGGYGGMGRYGSNPRMWQGGYGEMGRYGSNPRMWQGGYGEMGRYGSNPRMWQGGYGEMGRYGSSRRDYHAFEGTTVQGGSLKTWSFTNPSMERVQVNLETDGRPLNADIDLWHGPDNTPLKIAVYSEDGMARPFNAVIETPGGQNALRIRNTASLEYPLRAIAETDREGFVWQRTRDPSRSMQIQGGASETYTVEPQVGSVAVLMQTDGRPLNARIELLQGPNNNRQVIDIYTEDGIVQPFYAIIQTPGAGNVVRVLNTATMEYPLMCIVEPYSFGNYGYGNYGYDQGRFGARPYGEPWGGVGGRSKRRLSRDEIFSYGRNM